MVKVIAAGAVVASTLVVGPLPAEARVNGPRYDSRSIQCGAAQDRADKLVAEYGKPGTTNARKQEILAELQRIADFWDTFCRTRFGSINPVAKTGSTGPASAPAVGPVVSR